MASPKRSLARKEADFNILADRYVMGVPQYEIAAEIGISQGQVSQDIKKLLKRWEASQVQKIDVLKAEQLLRINKIEREAWDQWNKSKTTPRKVVTKSHSGSASKPTPEFARMSTTTEDAMGDPAYMGHIMWCVSERSKLLGLYAPKKIANTNIEGDKEVSGSGVKELMDMINDVADRLSKAPPLPSIDGEVLENDEVVDVPSEAIAMYKPLDSVKYPSETADLIKKRNKERANPTATIPEGTSPIIEATAEPSSDLDGRDIG